MAFNAQDFTYPNPPNDMKKKMMPQSSMLMKQVKKAWGMKSMQQTPMKKRKK